MNLKILKYYLKKKKQNALSFEDKTWPNLMIFVALFSLEADVVLQEKLATVIICDVLILQVKS